MPIHKHPQQEDQQDQKPTLAKRLFEAKPEGQKRRADARDEAPVGPSAVHGGAGQGEPSAIHKALRQWQDAGGEQGTRGVEATQAHVEGGASLGMKPLSLPTNQLNKQAQAEVEQHGAVPVQLVGARGQPIAMNVAATDSAQNGQGGPASGGVQWSQGELPPDYQQNLDAYGIQTVVGPDGRITVTSNNIRVEVQSLGAEFDAMFAGKSEAEINQMLDQWRTRKNSDDALGYGNLQNAAGDAINQYNNLATNVVHGVRKTDKGSRVRSSSADMRGGWFGADPAT